MIEPSVAILLWIPASFLAFALMSPVRAAAVAYLGGWLLLPIATIELPGLNDIDKMMATNIGVIAGTLVFYPGRLIRFRPHWADFILVGFCVSGLLASLTNGLGPYDGLSRTLYLFLKYGVPYVAGRLFLRQHDDLYQAARLCVLASGAYAFLAVTEWRLSPQTHNVLYGTFPHDWQQHVRWGFYRPLICFEHALALGTFFAWTALLAVWMWWHRLLKAPWGLPAWTLAAAPCVGLLSSMSFGPWGMFLMGLGLLILRERFRIGWAVAIPVLLAVAWMSTRYVGVFHPEAIIQNVAKLSKDRSDSFHYRVRAEDLLVAHAQEKPLFGWGTWGRNRAVDENGIEVATDGFWVIVLGTSGLFGLGCFYTWWSAPVLLSTRRGGWMHRDPVVAAMRVSIGLLALGLIFNAFLDPVLAVMSGCLIKLLQEAKRFRPAAVSAQPARANLPTHIPPTAWSRRPVP